MKWPIVIALTLGLAGCDAQTGEADMTSAIEREIRLPVGAHPLNAYARVYAYAPDDKVVAIYFFPSKPDQRLCEEEREIEFKERSEGASRFCPPPKGLIAGERRWITDYTMLPGAHDGGCNYIDVEYDMKAHSFAHVACHGEVG